MLVIARILEAREVEGQDNLPAFPERDMDLEVDVGENMHRPGAVAAEWVGAKLPREHRLARKALAVMAPPTRQQQSTK